MEKLKKFFILFFVIIMTVSLSTGFICDESDSSGSSEKKKLDTIRATLTVHYTNPGDDGDWYTEDDLVGFYRITERFPYTTKELWYNSGADATWFTADDEIYSWIIFEYNTAGQIIKSHDYREPGVDGKLFTSDDVRYFYDTHFYDSDGRWILLNHYDDNDVLQWYRTYEYASDGSWTRYINYFPDGNIQYYIIWEYVDDFEPHIIGNWGNIKRYSFYVDGGNGIWFDDDDVITGYATCEQWVVY